MVSFLMFMEFIFNTITTLEERATGWFGVSSHAADASLKGFHLDGLIDNAKVYTADH